MTTTKWVLFQKEFSNFNLKDILLSYEAFMACGPSKIRRSIFWSPPPFSVLKLNVNGVARGKPGLQVSVVCAS